MMTKTLSIMALSLGLCLSGWSQTETAPSGNDSKAPSEAPVKKDKSGPKKGDKSKKKSDCGCKKSCKACEGNAVTPPASSKKVCDDKGCH